VVPRLQEIDPPVTNQIDDAMLFGKSSRPCAAWEVFERFGLSDPGDRIAQDRLNEIKCSEGDLSIRLHPVLQVLDELGLEHGHPLTRALGRLRSTPLLGQDRALF